MAAPLRRACMGRVRNFILCQDGGRSVQVLINVYRSCSQKGQEDFFGIAEDQLHASEDVSAPSETEMQKLLRTFHKKKKNSEVVVQTYFGQVRLDSKARKSSLGGLDAEHFLQRISKTSAGEVSGSNKELELKKELSRRRKARKESKATAQHHADQVNEKTVEERSVFQQQVTNYFEEQYFGSVLEETFPNAEIARVQEQTHKPSIDGSSEKQADEIEPEYSKSGRAFGKTEASRSVETVPSESMSDNIIDQAYFSRLSRSADLSPKDEGNVTSSNSCQSSFIDQQYFPNIFESEEHNPNMLEVEDEHSISPQTQTGPAHSHIEDKMSSYDGDLCIHSFGT